MKDSETGGHHRVGLAGAALGALGIVYGDIGTSPLYAIRETFEGHGHELAVSEGNVLGVLSLVFYSLIAIICVKYLLFVMRAENGGEGGVLALTSLLKPAKGRLTPRWALILAGLFGTALLYGDGAITPAISVLAAVEGTTVAAPGLESWIIPLAVVILIGLFAIQSKGTEKVGRVFGPVMLIWFGTLALLGAVNLVQNLDVLRAINPVYAVRFFGDNGFPAFLSLGSVFLVVTGGEALYADMGHFGRRPIMVGWFTLVFPALLLNYFGQGALLLREPEAIHSPFYLLAPGFLVLPLVVLATIATVIASQALISGLFSLTMQAVQMDYAPRVSIDHTSQTTFGQVYIPAVNWGLLAACLGLVLGFRSSTALAAAYGVAVTATMVITTILFAAVARERFGWSRLRVVSLACLFLLLEGGFFAANLFKIPAGGWFPLVVGTMIFTVLTTWHRGRKIVRERIHRAEIGLTTWLETTFDGGADDPLRIPGTAVYMFGVPRATPPALIVNERHHHVLHERIYVVAVQTDMVPSVPAAERSEVLACGNGVWSVVLHYGFTQEPEVPRGLTEGAVAELGIDVAAATFFVSTEALRATKTPGMALWRERLFTLVHRNATSASDYFGLPPAQMMIVGYPVEL